MATTRDCETQTVRPLLLTEQPNVNIQFCKPYVCGKELDCIVDALESSATDGKYTKICHTLLRERLGALTLITQSCTAALEMAAVLADIQTGDEVIMPSYTFVSTANAFVLRGAVIVFVDCHRNSCNIDERLVESAITPRTKAIVCVHYGGVVCEMDALLEIATKHSILLIEDAAQAIGATYKGRQAGGIGHMGALSFHYTKNVVCGEGGALCVRDEGRQNRAWVVWEKGTNRHDFMSGKVDKYCWLDVGSSYLPSEITAAMLSAQLAEAEDINAGRVKLWDLYHKQFESLEQEGLIERPHPLPDRTYNAHIYHIFTPHRDRVIAHGKSKGIQLLSHYVPLHSSPGGMRFGRVSGTMENTDRAGRELLRVPLWPRMPEDCVTRVVEVVREALVHDE